MLTFAEITGPNVTEQFLGSWVAAAIVLLVGIAALFGIVEFFATRREVNALKERVDRADKAIEALTVKLDTTKTEVLNAGSIRAANLHIRCDQILGTQSEMKGQLSSFTSLLAELLKKEIHK